MTPLPLYAIVLGGAGLLLAAYLLLRSKPKSPEDVERERSLIDQWVCLTEERNEVLVPAAGSGVPGAPADWSVFNPLVFRRVSNTFFLLADYPQRFSDVAKNYLVR